MADRKSTLLFTLTSLLVCFSCSFQAAKAQIHHVVGDDRGWDRSSNVASWAARRIFRVGDFVWFAYSAAEENIVELRNKDDYESCDVSNPIKMYTDGLSKVSLDGEGTRYFISGNTESCKKGLKIPVQVRSKSWIDPNPVVKSKPATTSNNEFAYNSEKDALAAAPSTPSYANKIGFGNGFIILVVGSCWFFFFFSF